MLAEYTFYREEKMGWEVGAEYGSRSRGRENGKRRC